MSLENYKEDILRSGEGGAADWVSDGKFGKSEFQVGRLTNLMRIGSSEVERNRAADFLRLYMSIHADHEGGNLSSHSASLVNSGWGDPCLAISASLCALSGPLHGLASERSLIWIVSLLETLPSGCDTESKRSHIRSVTEEALKSKRLVPGYGHATLKVTDPRFSLINDWLSVEIADPSELLR